MNRLSFLFALSMLLFAAPTLAFAQQSESPYAPKLTPLSELIVTERFDRVPVEFPWPLLSSDRVSTQGRLDFELVYDVEFEEVREFLNTAYAEAQDVATLRPGTLRFTDVRHLRIAGIEMGETRARITLGHPDMEPVFRVQLRADGRRTRVVVANSTVSRQFSGFMPARVGFRPAGAEPIPFRWN